MRFPDSIRAHLTAALPELARSAEALSIHVTGGTVAARMTENLGYELRYTLNIVLLNCCYAPGQIFLPLLLWMRANQPELLLNHQDGVEKIRFAVDPVDNQAVDIEIQLPLAEAVNVLPHPGGGYEMTVREQPPMPGLEPLTDPLAILRQIWGKADGVEQFIVGYPDD